VHMPEEVDLVHWNMVPSSSTTDAPAEIGLTVVTTRPGGSRLRGYLPRLVRDSIT
jgi:hypothetical protein